jgi:hypothetical protein
MIISRGDSRHPLASPSNRLAGSTLWTTYTYYCTGTAHTHPFASEPDLFFTLSGPHSQRGTDEIICRHDTRRTRSVVCVALSPFVLFFDFE